MNLNPQGTEGPDLSCNDAAIVRVGDALLSSVSMPAAAAGSAACPPPSGQEALSRFRLFAHHTIFRSVALACSRLPPLGPEPSGMDETSGSRLIQPAGDSLSAGGLRVAAKDPASRWAKADMISRVLMRGEGVLIRREADEQRSIRIHTLALARRVRHRSPNPQSTTPPPTPAGAARWATTTTSPTPPTSPPSSSTRSAALSRDLLRAGLAEAVERPGRELRLAPVGCRPLAPSSVVGQGRNEISEQTIKVRHGSSSLRPSSARRDQGGLATVVWKSAVCHTELCWPVARWEYLDLPDAMSGTVEF